MAEALKCRDLGDVAMRGHFFRGRRLFRLEALLMQIPAVLGQFFNSRQPHIGGDYALIAAMSGWTPMMFMTRVRL